MAKSKILKLISVTICAFMLLMIPVQSFAQMGVDEGALTVVFRHEEIPIAGVNFRIYHIGQPSENGYTLTNKFSGYSVYLNDLDSDGLNELASTVSAYVVRDSVAPDAEGQTNIYGSYKFDSLPLGIYLVMGDNYTEENITYVPKPFIVVVPSADSDGNPMYELSAEPKYDMWDEDTESPAITERRALKIWKDSEYPDKRPQQIVVQLLCDGELYDEAVLNEANNWAYTWSDLEENHVWLLAEKSVPTDYTVSVAQHEVTFTITNTFRGDIPKEPQNPDKSKGTPDTSLPKTGQLWWPVPVLLAAGIILSVAGILFKRNGGSYNA